MRRIFLFLFTTSVLPAAAFAQQQPEATGADAADEATEIIVFGRGETRQVQEVSGEDLKKLAAGTSPLKAVAQLPSVNFQSADAFGNYEWSQRITIRGFNQQQLGFTLDGIPLGDFSYGNNNGLHISRAISPENIGTIRVTQGAGALGTQSTNNLGGTLEFQSRNPSTETEIAMEGTYGEDNTIRAFTRIDSGGEAIRGYVSYAYLGMDKWKGFGKQVHHMVNGKVVAPLGGDAQLTATASYSDRREQDYQDLTLEMIRRLGYRADNISDNFPLAVRLAQIGANRGNTGAPITNPAAGTVFPAPYTSVDDAYFDASGLRKDTLASLKFETPINEQLSFDMTGYYHKNKGQGIWFTPYVATPGGAPLSVRTTEYDIKRGGLFGSLTYETDNNQLELGAWYETNDFTQARRFYGLTSLTTPSRSARKFQTNPFFTQWLINFDTKTFQYFVQDRLELGDLTISLGWKGYKVTNRSTPKIAGGLASGKIGVKDWFQPSAGLVYKIDDRTELFAGFAQSTRAYPSSATSGPFATTQAGFDALKLKPEESDTYELGVRTGDNRFQGVLSAYLVNFRNRLLGFRNGAGIVGNPAILNNVGGVRSWGLEAGGRVTLSAGFSAYLSYSYNDATYRNDVRLATGAVQAVIKGKTVVDSPKHLIKAELAYDKGAVNGRIGANYVSRRYFTYTNDQSVPGRVLIDASIAYRLDDLVPDLFKGLELQGSVTNLTDKKYVATIGSNGFGNSGDNQTLLAGAPRTLLVTVKAKF